MKRAQHGERKAEAIAFIKQAEKKAGPKKGKK